MSCREARAVFAALAESGTAGDFAATRPELAAHLATCPACRARLDRLARTILSADADVISCAECTAEAYKYVEAELAGLNAASMFPALQAHLADCPECTLDYDAARMAIAAAEPALPSRPVFSLPFLEAAEPVAAEQTAGTTRAMTRLVAWRPAWFRRTTRPSPPAFRAIVSATAPERLEPRWPMRLRGPGIRYALASAALLAVIAVGGLRILGARIQETLYRTTASLGGDGRPSASGRRASATLTPAQFGFLEMPAMPAPTVSPPQSTSEALAGTARVTPPRDITAVAGIARRTPVVRQSAGDALVAVAPVNATVLRGLVTFRWTLPRPLPADEVFDVRVCFGEACDPDTGRTHVRETEWVWCPDGEVGVYRWRIAVVDVGTKAITGPISDVSEFHWAGGDCATLADSPGPDDDPAAAPQPTSVSAP